MQLDKKIVCLRSLDYSKENRLIESDFFELIPFMVASIDRCSRDGWVACAPMCIQKKAHNLKFTE